MVEVNIDNCWSQLLVNFAHPMGNKSQIYWEVGTRDGSHILTGHGTATIDPPTIDPPTIDPPTIDPLCNYTGVNCREI